MKLNAPKQITFIISVILIILGLLSYLVPALPDFLNANAFWITFAGGVLVSLGCMVKGL